MKRRLPPIWLLVSAAWLGPAILAAFQAYVQGRLGNRDPATLRSVLWEGGDWLLYAFLTPAAFWVAHRFPLTRPNLGRNLAVHVAASIALCAAWAGCGILLWRMIFPEPATPWGGGALGWFVTSLPFGVAVYFAVVGVQHAAFYFLEARERETQTAQLSAQLSDARLRALRMQMQPHFLYNSLNAITVILRDRDTVTATRMLEQLGDMLRRVMRTDGPQEVSLADEIGFLRQLLSIEEARFTDRLRPEFDVDPSLLNVAVPEFVLQPLVENALRHGLAKRVTATLLRISVRREADVLVMTVTDDGPGPSNGITDEERGEGVGLSNTRERLAVLYGTEASLTLAPMPGGGAAATIRIPYRELAARNG